MMLRPNVSSRLILSLTVAYHLQARNERKVTRVMGCALSRQFNVPDAGAWMSAIVTFRSVRCPP